MASIKELKKHIDNIVFQVIYDCQVYAELHPGNESDEVFQIIEDVVQLRNDLFTRVNNPEGKNDPKIIRSHYQAIKKDLITGTDQLFIKLSSLTKKKKQ